MRYIDDKKKHQQKYQPVVKSVTPENKELATAISIHTNVNSRTATTVLTNVQDYQNPDIDDQEKIVTLSRKLRSVEGVCASVADLLIDFAITEGSFYSDNDDLKILLNKWANFVNSSAELSKQKGVIFPTPGIRALARRIFDNYITDGDAIFTLFWKKIKISPVDTEAFMLPSSIKTLDCLSLKIDEDLIKIGIEQITLKLDDKIIKKIKNPQTDADKYLKEIIPPEWVKMINSGKDIVLDPNVTYHLKRNGKDWKAWGEPLFLKAFSAVAAKRRMQAVDDATIDGLINRLTVFKVGLPDKERNPAYHIPSAARVQALVQALQTPKRSNAIVWPGPDLEILDIGADGKILEFAQKYKQADTDILRALHVAPLLIDGGSSGQTTRDWAAFLSTEVGLDAVRSELETLFTKIGEEIALTNNIKYEQLNFKFKTLSLRDEQTVRNFALKVYELGCLSTETFVGLMGYDFEMERRIKENEQSDGTKELFINPNVPGFTGVTPGVTTPTLPDGGDGKEPGTKTDKSGTAALDSVTSYYQLYLSAFEKLENNLLTQSKIDPNFVRVSFISGFSQFKLLVESQIRSTFLQYSNGNITKELEFVLDWSNKYLSGFYNTLSNDLNFDVPFKGMLTEKYGYRLFLYASAGYKKAKIAGLIAIAKFNGISSAKWICSSENSTCKEHHNKVYPLDYFLENFPGHPECKCQMKLEID